MSYPIKVRSEQAGLQTFLRLPGSCDAGSEIGLKLCSIMWCGSSSIFTQLSPDVFSRVEFRCSSRKVVNDQTFLRRQKFLYHLAFVDRMIIPDKDDGIRSAAQQLLEKFNGFFAGQTMPIGTKAQLELFPIWQNQQDANDIETVMMADTGADSGRFTTPRPGALERRNQ